MSGLFTLVYRNATAIGLFCLMCQNNYSSLAMRWWNSCDLSSGDTVKFSLVMSKWLVAGVFDVPGMSMCISPSILLLYSKMDIFYFLLLLPRYSSTLLRVVINRISFFLSYYISSSFLGIINSLTNNRCSSLSNTSLPFCINFSIPASFHYFNIPYVVVAVVVAVAAAAAAAAAAAVCVINYISIFVSEYNAIVFFMGPILDVLLIWLRLEWGVPSNCFVLCIFCSAIEEIVCITGKS